MNIKIIHGSVCIDGRIVLGAKIDELFSNQGMEIPDMPAKEPKPAPSDPWVSLDRKGVTIEDLNRACNRVLEVQRSQIEKMLESLAKRVELTYGTGSDTIFRAEKENWK